MAARNGASVFVDTSSNSGSTNITVPVGTTLAMLQWAGFTGSAQTMVSMSLDGVSGTAIGQTGGTGSSFGAGAFRVSNPTIGSVSLAWDFEGTSAFTVGAKLAVSFFLDVDLASPVRDWGVAAADGTANLTDTLTSASDDFVHIFAVSYDASSNTAVTGQTTDEEPSSFAAAYVDIAHVNTPGSSSTPVEANGAFYGAAVFVALRNTSGAGSNLLKKLQLDGGFL